MKFLILLSYFNRPLLIRNTLQSIVDQTHKDWHLVLVDDCSPQPLEEIARDVLKDHWDHQVTFYRIDERSNGQSVFGAYFNKGIKENLDCDAAIMTSDDDALLPDYLTNLTKWFCRHSNLACWSQVHIYNPGFEDYHHVQNLNFHLNFPAQESFLRCRKDSTQVAWRTAIHAPHGVWFPEAQTTALDAELYGGIDRYGPTPFSGLVGQSKGWHTRQASHLSIEEIWSGADIDLHGVRATTPAHLIKEMVGHYYLLGNISEAERIAGLYKQQAN